MIDSIESTKFSSTHDYIEISQNRYESTRSSNGFTLVELLIVTVVIALLATISIVAYRGIQERSYYSVAYTEMNKIAKAMTLYKIQNGSLPPDVSQGIPAPIVAELGLTGSGPMLNTNSWPGSYYDYENWDLDGDGTKETFQVSIRFCRDASGNPVGENGVNCRYPRQDWADDFVPHSSVFYCLEGYCGAHLGYPDAPAYCVNCPNNEYIPVP